MTRVASQSRNKDALSKCQFYASAKFKRNMDKYGLLWGHMFIIEHIMNLNVTAHDFGDARPLRFNRHRLDDI